jgi:hypothetical protein
VSVSLVASLALSLGLTIILEAGFFLIVGKRDKKDLLLLVLVNVITNPVVVLSYSLVILYTNWNTRLLLIGLESLAVVVEGALYARYGRQFRRPFLFALAANLFSFGTGVLIQWLF